MTYNDIRESFRQRGAWFRGSRGRNKDQMAFGDEQFGGKLTANRWLDRNIL
jgi:hypothetical protein